jgi:hypothetical protein
MSALGQKPTCAVQLGVSALGQKQTFAPQKVMSTLPPKENIWSAARDVRFGPKADMVRCIRSPRPDGTSMPSTRAF